MGFNWTLYVHLLIDQTVTLGPNKDVIASSQRVNVRNVPYKKRISGRKMDRMSLSGGEYTKEV